MHPSGLSSLPDPSACDEKQRAVKNSVSTKGERGRGGVGEEPALQGALRLCNRCQLPAHRAPERRAVGADSEAPEKQALREKFEILEKSSCQALLDSQVMRSSGG